MAISIYDMDRTITRGGTWGPWLRFWLRAHAPWRALLLPALAVPAFLYGQGAISRGQLKAWAHRIVMGKRVARVRVEAAAADYARMVVAEGCFEGALAQIAADRAAGRRLVLATASNAYYAEAIGAALGFDAVIATPPRWEGEWLDWRLGGENCYGEAKRVRVAAWLSAHATADEAVRFYSDHHSDAPVFALVADAGGEAVVANGTAALRAMADEKGWPQMVWGQPRSSWFERA